MNQERFEKYCRQAKCAPVKKVTLGECEVLIADGYRDRHSEYAGPAYRTIWATSRNGMDICRSLYIKVGDGDLHARINAAMKDAEIWVGANIEVGRYA